MNPIETLTTLFEKFPGIGPRQARRFVQYLLSEQPALRLQLADAIRYLGAQTSQCKNVSVGLLQPQRQLSGCVLFAKTQHEDKSFCC